MIRAQNLTFRHPGADRDALADLSFQVEDGAVCCLAGVNGSGKSTLLHLLAGVFSPTKGSLVMESGPDGLKAALLPQDPDVYILGSLVREDLLLALDPTDEVGRSLALAMAARFGLDALLDEPVQTLSHGQKRQLCLASAMASRPGLLLLDEPFAGLDLPAALVLRDVLRENKRNGMTQVISGHDLDLFADLVDGYVLLHKGELAAAGNADAVFPDLLHYGVRPPGFRFS